MFDQATAQVVLPSFITLNDLVRSRTVVGERRIGQWTGREVTVLRRLYPQQGLAGVMPSLPGRTAGAIVKKAREIGVTDPNAAPKPPGLPWASSPHIDDRIREGYRRHSSARTLHELAASLGRPLVWVVRRAGVLGVTVPRVRPLPWSEAEEAILRRHRGHGPSCAAKELRDAGFRRTEGAIASHMLRMGVSTAIPRFEGDPDAMSVAEVAIAMGVREHAVRGWIARHLLVASKDHRGNWFNRADVGRFVIANVGVVDVVKADKFWLIDLVAETARGDADRRVKAAHRRTAKARENVRRVQAGKAPLALPAPKRPEGTKWSRLTREQKDAKNARDREADRRKRAAACMFEGV